MVSKADRIKAAERVRTGHPTLGGSPLKRRRAIYRALERGDLSMQVRFQCELQMLQTLEILNRALYNYQSPKNCDS